ncbi:MAG: hypothetical protein EZS28_001372 [Streblomastix strix]|uniref:Uncharacterized protein n=1 Tax=Streblomastix strix TaxID=222440 RepID=A0A5J4X7F9_9EUKA|nr:MAG: hypothetical protein EZS28_001372 [Streblomastix strix]
MEIEVNAVIVAVTSQIDPFQQPFQQQVAESSISTKVIRCETPTLSARHRSSIFEETLTPDPSMCRWLLDIISDEEHIVQESFDLVQRTKDVVVDSAVIQLKHQMKHQLETLVF